MAAKLKDELQLEAELITLIRGDNGVFDVVADGKLIFSKDSEGRFPEEREIVSALSEG